MSRKSIVFMKGKDMNMIQAKKRFKDEQISIKEVGLMNNCLSCGTKLCENITIYNCSRNLIDYVTDARRWDNIKLDIKARRCSKVLKTLKSR